MRGLAEFAMGGRFRALLIAIASSGSLLFAWVGAAMVALVTLRKGQGEGFWVLLWATLPALVVAQATGDTSILAMLMGTAALAAILRGTVSLTLTALCTVVVGLGTGMLLLVFAEGLLAELSKVFGDFFSSLDQRSIEAGGQALNLSPPSQLQLAGMMGTANAALCFLCLVLGRYWQAALYNPGGFGEEFRSLVLPKAVVWGLALIALGLASIGLAYRSWGAAFLVPLTIAGFALLHARAKFRGQSSFWMGSVYTAWIVFDAAKLALILLVLADTLVGFRARWGQPKSRGGEHKQDKNEDEHEDKDE
ncbi:MAG: hypothetical protein Cons2KO_29560 [Congregibacter sp.]